MSSFTLCLVQEYTANVNEFKGSGSIFLWNKIELNTDVENDN